MPSKILPCLEFSFFFICNAFALFLAESSITLLSVFVTIAYITIYILELSRFQAYHLGKKSYTQPSSSPDLKLKQWGRKGGVGRSLPQPVSCTLRRSLKKTSLLAGSGGSCRGYRHDPRLPASLLHTDAL